MTRLTLTVASASEQLDLRTSYNYTLTVDATGAAVATADGPYGAMYAMQTFSALVHGGQLEAGSVSIRDWPSFAHRGFMIDTGRRFYPVPAVKSVLDGMAATKMNVLHFHASDFCRFSIESKKYPALTAALTGDLAGYYSQEDVADIVAYAGARGIRVIPEFDLPGHSKGFDPLGQAPWNMAFCTPDGAGPRIQLYDDPANTTFDILADLMTEMTGLFPDAVFNIGCDETHVEGNCTLGNIGGLEGKMQAVLRAAGKTPMGWEELLFDSHAAATGTIVDAWSRHTAGDVTAAGFQSVESASRDFYLNIVSTPYASMWRDIAPGFSAAQRKLMLGGEVSMWTDNYCYITQCGAFGTTGAPVGHQLFPPSMDAVWTKSVSGIMWPRAAVAGGSFWHYDATLDATSAEFAALYEAHNELLQRHGVDSCPSGCYCDELTRCGRPYLPPNCSAGPHEGQNVANFACDVAPPAPSFAVAPKQREPGFLRATRPMAERALEHVGADGTFSGSRVEYADVTAAEWMAGSGSQSGARAVDRMRGGRLLDTWHVRPDGLVELTAAPRPDGTSDDSDFCLRVSARPDPQSGSPNVDVAPCDDTALEQVWTYRMPSGHLVSRSNGQCLGVTAHSPSSGANVETNPCHHPVSINQQWLVNSTGYITSSMNGYCLGAC